MPLSCHKRQMPLTVNILVVRDGAMISKVGGAKIPLNIGYIADEAPHHEREAVCPADLHFSGL